MLPNIHRQCYQKFSEVLQHLQQTGDRTPIDPLTLHNSFSEAQQFFQHQIVSLDAGDLEAGDESRVRSYQTEISKQLRILGMDVKFLQAARQEETIKARQMQLLERLKMLQGYCDRILELN